MTIADLSLSEVGIVELAVLFAALGYVTQLVLDVTGWSRSSRTLRQENEDLIRRNKELADDIARQRGDILNMQTKVTELSKRDQGAVLEAMAIHEQSVSLRHEKTLAVLMEIRDAVKA